MALEPLKQEEMEMKVNGFSVKKIKVVAGIMLAVVIILVIKK